MSNTTQQELTDEQTLAGIRSWWGALFAFGLVVGLATVARADQSCVPAVRLEGEPEVRAVIAEQLEAHGVLTRGDLGCVRVVVQIAVIDTGLDLRIADVQGRTENRQVSDVATAVAVIEAWATPALLDPGTPDSPLSSSAPAVNDADRHADDSSAVTPKAATASRDRDGFAVGVWLGPTWAGDRTLWGDLTVTGCGRVGPMCVGGTFQASLDFGELGKSKATDTDRTALSFLGSVDVPITVGKGLFMPGFDAGLGWTRMVVDDDDPLVPTGQFVRRNDVSFRMGVHVRAAIEVAPHVRLGTGIALEIAPIARTGLIKTRSGVTLASTPRWHLRSMIGLQFDTL